jgi:glucose/mannose transport system permease protein
VLSLWKFRGSEVMFGFMLFGVFMPFQVAAEHVSWFEGQSGVRVG